MSAVRLPDFRQWKTMVDAELARRNMKSADCGKHTRQGGWNAEKAFQAGDSPEQYVDRVDGKPYRHQPGQTSFQPLPGYLSTNNPRNQILAVNNRPIGDSESVTQRKVQWRRGWSAKDRTLTTVTWADGLRERYLHEPPTIAGFLAELAEQRDILTIYIENEFHADPKFREAASWQAPECQIVATYNPQTVGRDDSESPEVAERAASAESAEPTQLFGIKL